MQVTGRFDTLKGGLLLEDGGGFYDFDDNVNSPPGGSKLLFLNVSLT